MKTKKSQRKKPNVENKTKRTLIYGIHAITHVLQQQPERLLHFYIAKERQDKKIIELLAEIRNQGFANTLVSQSALDNMTEDANHQGIVAECKPPKIYHESDLPHFIENAKLPILFLILDNIQDPHNLGACFRSAEAFAATAIIAPRDNAASITATVSKVASGAAEIVPFIQVTNLARAMSIIKEHNIWIYGADEAAKDNLFTTNLTSNIAIALGSEGDGLRRLTKENCDGLIKIPMSGTVGSLNVSVATGIFLAEVTRQRLGSKA